MARTPVVNHRFDPAVAHVIESVEECFPDYVDYKSGPMGWVTITPAAQACPMYVIELGDEFVFGVGHGNCRWEFELTPEDVALFEAVWAGTVAGNVREWEAPGRAYIEVDLSDGSTVKTSTHVLPRSLLPHPFWRRGTRRMTQYSAYD